MALASLVSWSLQNNSGFTFTAFINGLSRPPHSWTLPATCLVSTLFFKLRGRVYNPFVPLSFLVINTNPCTPSGQVLLLPGAGIGSTP